MTRRFGIILASAGLIALLGGCHHEEKATGHGTVSGEILPGSISDAMLPYDAVKSKAPVAPEQVAGPARNGRDDNVTDSADMAANSASAAPDVAASPGVAASAVAN